MLGMEMDGDQMTGWWGMYFGPFTMLVILVVTVALIIFLAKLLIDKRVGKADLRDNAMALLKERFAKGEIDKREFEDRKSQLQGR